MRGKRRERIECRAAAYSPGPATVSTPVSTPVFGSAPPVPVAGKGPPPLRSFVVPKSQLEVDYSKIQFLMRVVGFPTYGCEYNGKFYRRDEFYKIWVERDYNGELKFVAKRWCESQLSSLDDCFMLQVGSRIYNICRLFRIVNFTHVPQSLQINRNEKLGCHTGLSWIDMNDPKRWNPGAPLERHESFVESAAFGDYIYSLHSTDVTASSCYPTLEDKWMKCNGKPPKELFQCSVTKKMINQPTKNRILVHLTTKDFSESYLYGWTPQPQHSWELITQDIDDYAWKEQHPNVVNDIIYFYGDTVPPYFRAYHLGFKKWVKVKWSAEFPPGAAGDEVDSMFYLGNRIFCLAKSCPITILDHPVDPLHVWGYRVTFSLFRFYVTSTDIDGPLVIFTHLFTNSLACRGIWSVDDFVSLCSESMEQIECTVVGSPSC